MERIKTALAALIIGALVGIAPGCVGLVCLDGTDYCFGYEGDTGDEEEAGEWTCALVNNVRVCTLTPLANTYMQEAIEAGALTIFSTEDTCDNPSDPWYGLVRQTVFDGESIEWHICDYDPLDLLLCMPELRAWNRPGSIGAIAVNAWGLDPHCDELPALDLLYKYQGAASICAGMPACMGLATECGCSCDGDWACYEQESQLEATFYGIDALDGLELRCTGYPWQWEQGQFFGGSCESAQADPFPGEIPNPLHSDAEVSS